MFSYRECIRPLMPYVPGRPIEDVKKEYGLDRAVKLASNENPLGCSKNVREAVIRSLDEPALYPDGACGKLRALVAKKLGVPENAIVFGAGTDEVISLLGKVFINEGDECITAAVTFSQYAASVLSMGGKMVYAPMKDHAYDLDAILGLITDKTKMIFLANPNNPTGTAFDCNAQEAFIKKVPEHIIVVFDEAYAEYVTDFDYPDTISTMKNHKNVILLKTFSKAYGLASFRVGYGVSDPSISELMEKIRNPFNVSVQAQEAAIAAFEDREFVEFSAKHNKSVLTYTYNFFEDMGLFYIPSYTNFVMVDVKKDSREVFQALMKKGYIIRPGAAFGMDSFLRITIGTKEDMDGLFSILKEII